MLIIIRVPAEDVLCVAVARRNGGAHFEKWKCNNNTNKTKTGLFALWKYFVIIVRFYVITLKYNGLFSNELKTELK